MDKVGGLSERAASAAIERTLANACIPTPSPVLQRLAELSDSDTTPLADIATLIRCDPGLTARVASVACSASFAGDRPLSSLEHCLARLGTRLIRSMALCLGVQRLLEPLQAPLRHALDAFWTHSLTVAELAGELARLSGSGRSDALYLAGLLHDVGPFLLLAAEGEAYAGLLAACPDDAELCRRERARWGLDHRELAGALLARWGLADGPGDALLGLHVPASRIASAPPAAQILWLTHTLLASPPEIDRGQLLAPVPQLGLNSEQLAPIVERARLNVRRLGEGLGWQLPDATAASHWTQHLYRGAGELAQPAAPETEAGLEASVGLKAVLQPLAAQLAETASPASLWLAMREAAGVLFNLRQLAILDFDAAADRLDGRPYTGQPAALAQCLPLDETSSVLCRAAASGRPESVFPEESADSSLTDLLFARALRSPGLLAIPMRPGGELRGVLAFGILPGDLDRRPALLPRLSAFATICAQALDQHSAAAAEVDRARSTAEAEFLLRGRRLAHEAGNPLSIIQSYLVLLGRRLPAEADVSEELAVLREEIQRVGDILDGLRDVPANQPDAICDAAQLVGDLLRVYRGPLFSERDIALDLAVSGGPLVVACPRDSLTQLLLNLLKNASEALGAGNALRLELAPAVCNGVAQVELCLSDNGPGLPPHAVQALGGDPVRTLGGRRGHGLSLVAELARRHDIAVTLRTASGAGTRLTFLLPAALLPGSGEPA